MDGETQPNYSGNSYAGLIAQHFSVPYVCLTHPGIGNDSIERMITEYLMLPLDYSCEEHGKELLPMLLVPVASK